ncbi:MAG: hypothetical protein AAF456_01590 [Planctomycetota bacterium]
MTTSSPDVTVDSTPLKPGLPDRQSSALDKAPILTPRGLTTMLALMCVIPVVTILGLWQMMPPVYEGQLEAAARGINLPPPSFYDEKYDERPEVAGPGELLVTNKSDQEWTHLNIQVNSHYQIYDVEPIPAGAQRSFRLDRFLSRTGAKFQVRYNPLKSVRVYARRPGGDRATFYYEFDENGE